VNVVKSQSEFQKFDNVMRKILSVSHDELKRQGIRMEETAKAEEAD
jgi:hypothetical protein